MLNKINYVIQNVTMFGHDVFDTGNVSERGGVTIMYEVSIADTLYQSVLVVASMRYY